MASQFCAAINEKRYSLIEQLVTRLLHVQRDDENFSIAYDFCVQKAWFNTFPDVNPRETEELYASLVERLEADSQLTKAAALSALTNKLLALKLQSTAGVPDLNHNLLQLLASLSDQPLSSSFELTPDVLGLLYNPADRLATITQQQQPQQQQEQQLEEQQQPASKGRFQRLLQGAAGKAASSCDADRAASSDDEVDPYGEQDKPLSDWGDSDTQQQQQQPWRQEDSSNTEQDADQDLLQPQEHQQQLRPQQQQLWPQGSALMARQVAAAALPHGCVVAALQQPLPKLHILRPQPMTAVQRMCLSEHFLAQQVLRVLQGLPAQGFFMQDPRHTPQTPSQQQQQPGEDSNKSSAVSSTCSSGPYFEVDGRVSTPQMATSSLHALLGDAAAAGTCHRRMRALVQQLAYGSSIMANEPVEVTPCLRAFGVALQQQLDGLGMQLADLQQLLQQEYDQRASSSATGSLHDGSRLQQHGERGLLMRCIRCEARPVVQRLHLLHDAVFEILLQLDGPPAAVSAGLIDGLAAAAHAASSCDASGPQGVSGAAALLHLLLSSCVPLSRALAQWLWCAEDNVAEPQQGQSDAVAQGPTASGDHKQQQQEQGASVCASGFFILRKASTDLSAVHPSFWHTAYGFSQKSTPPGSRANAGAGTKQATAAVCCPAVLAPFVHSIITAGKSMRLLDYMDQENLKRSGLCSSSRATALGAQAGQGQTAAAQQQQLQRPASARPSGMGSAQQRRPSTPLRRRPSSAGPRITDRVSAATAAAQAAGGILAGRLSRQPSWTGRPASAAAAAGQHSTAGSKGASKGGSSGRKKWEVQPTPPVPPACDGEAAAVYAVDRSAVARRVQLQLAAAAAVAGQQLVENELPHEFIGSVNFILQQEQELQAKAHATMKQHKQYLQDCSSSSTVSSSNANQLLLQRLEAVAAALARPNNLPAGAARDVQLPNLRGAVAAARKARASDAALLGKAKQTQQQHQQAAHLPDQPAASTGATAAQGATLTTAADSLERCSSSPERSPSSAAKAAAGPNTTNSSSSSSTEQGEREVPPRQPPDDVPAEPQTPPKAAGPTADPEAPAVAEAAPQATSAGANAAHIDTSYAASSSNGSGDGNSSPDVVPKLTVWKDQMEARLTAAHQHLQRMAPWQQDLSCSSADITQEPSDSKQQQQWGQHGSKGSARRHAGSSSSSGKNWLLRTADTKVPGHFTGSLAELWPLKPVLGLKDLAASGASWLKDAGWPGCELDWLLHHPPAHLPSVQELLWSALVQPVRTRVGLVDRQLMASLMGEWGMLQQLQGLVDTFLITSPGMVEWIDALFTAVETTAAMPQATRSGEYSTPTSVSKTVSRVGAAAALGCGSPMSYAASPGGGVVPGSAAGRGWVTVDDLELSSVEAMLQDCILSADTDEVLPDVNSLLLTVNREGLRELREQQEKRRAAAQAAGPAAAAGARQPPAAGLLLCSREWVGLELQHIGSWQLSLVYTDEHLRFFGQAWRVMLQLRWVRRQVGAQAVAHRVSATVNNLSARDRLESEQAAAALAASSSSRTLPRSAVGFGAAAFGAGYGGQHTELGGAGGMLDWLSGKEELLLLQEMHHFLGCWHSYVMDGLRVKAWGSLEQVLLSAKSLDQVHSATRAFFASMCNMCNLQPPGRAANKMRETTRQRLEGLMDHALAAALAAACLHAARQKLKELQGVAGREGDMLPWWRELAEARSRLKQAGCMWQKGLGELLVQWALLKKHGLPHAFDELTDLLDMNGYFSRGHTAALYG